MASDHAVEDHDMIERCVAGDAEAWAGLCERYSRLMRIAIRRELEKRREYAAHDIDDILQDSLSYIWLQGKLASLKNAASLPYWLAIVARNTALDWLRKAASIEPAEPLPSPDCEGSDDLDRHIASTSSDPAERLHRRESAKRIDDSIERLPEKEKLVMKLNILYGKKHDEIAEMLGMPKGSVSCYIRRGKKRLRNDLGGLL